MEFTPLVIVVLLVAFWWSGFVRAGLGFGGAGLMYPVALLAVDSIIFLVPLICVQLIVFSASTLARDYRKIDWPIFATMMTVILPAFMVGIFGLINFPEKVILLVVYVIIIYYSLTYIFDIRMQPRRWVDGPVLLLGGYLSGLSLAGAPIIAGIGIRYLDKERMRATLFSIWMILCIIKLATLAAVGIDLQLRHQVWLLPAALIGHLMGLKVHDRLIAMQSRQFYRWLCSALLLLSLTGLLQDFLFD